MTAPVQENQAQQPQVDPKQAEKEFNFRKQQQMYERQLEQERAERLRLQQELERRQQPAQQDDEDDDDEPYVQKKKLAKKLDRVSQNTQSEIQKAMEIAKVKAKEELKQEMWLENNPDFYDVLQNHSQKLYETNKELANNILQMPESFERQKLVYNNIKALGLHQDKPKSPSIQDKIDANRKSPFYQPTNVGNAPYSSQGDFSQAGQKNAYEQMQALKSRLRLG